MLECVKCLPFFQKGCKLKLTGNPEPQADGNSDTDLVKFGWRQGLDIRYNLKNEISNSLKTVLNTFPNI